MLNGVRRHPMKPLTTLHPTIHAHVIDDEDDVTSPISPALLQDLAPGPSAPPINNVDPTAPTPSPPPGKV